MPKFGVYYVPQPESDFYRLGTSVLGYDVRSQGSTPMPTHLRTQLGAYDPGWVRRARPYGFHLTIGDAIDFEMCSLSAIEDELSDLLGCFALGQPFLLRKRARDFVTFWGRDQEVVVLRYNADDRLKLLHALIVARVNPLGVSSGYVRRYRENPGAYAERPHQAQRIRKFYSPTVLDDYAPHFTLMNPYAGTDPAGLARAVRQVFAPFSVIRLESICLLVQMQTDETWHIHQEFPLSK